MKIKWLLFIGLIVFSQNAYAQLTIPKKKCTRGKCYFVDQTGKRISDYYEEVTTFKSELAAVNLKGKWGFINEQMEIVLPIEYEKVGDFKNGLTYVKQDNYFELIDMDGNSKSEKYDSIGYLNRYYVFKDKNKLGLIDENGEVVEKAKFDRMSTYYRNDFGVLLDGKWANYNNGNLIYDNPELYFDSPEEMPIFSKECINSEDLEIRKQCSDKALYTKIYNNIRYPSEARQKNIQGVVEIQFVINKKGAVDSFEIVKNVGGGCGKEALNVAKTYLRKWALPGMDNGEPVNTLYNLQIKFLLD